MSDYSRAIAAADPVLHILTDEPSRKLWGDRLALSALEAGYALTGNADVGVLEDGTVRMRCGWATPVEFELTRAMGYDELVGLIESVHGAAHR